MIIELIFKICQKVKDNVGNFQHGVFRDISSFCVNPYNEKKNKDKINSPYKNSSLVVNED